MCIWAVKAAEKCKRLVELLHQAILSGPLINIDETAFQVLCEPDRRVDSKSYMWVFRGRPPGKGLDKALNYTLGQWPRLIKYLDNGILRMDNNCLERAKKILHFILFSLFS